MHFKAAQVVDICQEDVLQHLVSLVACQCLTVAGSALTPSPHTCPLADRARGRPFLRTHRIVAAAAAHTHALLCVYYCIGALGQNLLYYVLYVLYYIMYYIILCINQG